MGLDFIVKGYPKETPSWSYSGFYRFRSKIISAIDQELGRMYITVLSETDEKKQIKIYEEIFKKLKGNDLYEFLFHSDCEGYLTPKKLKKIIRGLKLILPKINTFKMEYDYDYEKGMDLLKAMEFCVKENRRLFFW